MGKMNKVVDRVVNWWVGKSKIDLDLSDRFSFGGKAGRANDKLEWKHGLKRREGPAKYGSPKMVACDCGHRDISYFRMPDKHRICRVCYQKLMKEGKHI